MVAQWALGTAPLLANFQNLLLSCFRRPRLGAEAEQASPKGFLGTQGIDAGTQGIDAAVVCLRPDRDSGNTCIAFNMGMIRSFASTRKEGKTKGT